MSTQAERVIARFGGARKLHRALKRHGIYKSPSTIYKWTYSKENDGTDGVIPRSALADIMSIARVEGVFLTAEDLDPRPS